MDLSIVLTLAHAPILARASTPNPGFLFDNSRPGTPLTGRADIEGSKSEVAMNAWLPQVSYSSLPIPHLLLSLSLSFLLVRGLTKYSFVVVKRSNPGSRQKEKVMRLECGLN
ncbi:hypothetical protein BKA57DRAFT_304237 [Linnemannia elongata]|nr:hypothetical protein BKA57DRAFT_304237 [Linnemannia elongata]